VTDNQSQAFFRFELSSRSDIVRLDRLRMAGNLYIVATPIGNLQDISQRALDVLRSADTIACEDTRHTRKLLEHYRISSHLVSYHEHNERERAEELLDELKAGRSVAVVSDAGTPGICDPGFRIVDLAAESGITVIPIPGSNAAIAALSASALPTDAFFFGGFLPSKKGERKRRLTELRGIPATLVFYETPHRLIASLGDCLEVLGDRRAVVAREVTKLHEEFIRGHLSTIISSISDARIRGEVVLMLERETLERAETPTDQLVIRFAAMIGEGIERKIALKRVAKEFGVPRAEAYRLVESSKS
jgi:16S rRNA (cytidine1402-2'-O)-methyltransferase